MNNQEIESNEHKLLNSYACFSDTATRHMQKAKPKTRSDFQRDRDRIIYSKAFRRLEYKTQVYLTQQGDHLRTRLTHSLEVSQLSRSICLHLGLNQDLAEAIALGHDLGHSPFGHAGEKQLEVLARKFGYYFKHNVQSVRVVDKLEKKYDYDGLNLTLAVREGMLKHTSFPPNLPVEYQDLYLDKPFSVTLEGQVVAVADEIAQATHDFDDYMRYNIFNFRKLKNHRIFKLVEKFNFDEYSFDLNKTLKKCKNETERKDILIRSLVDFLVTTLVRDAEVNLKNQNLKAYEIARIYICFNDDLDNIFTDFKDHFFKLIMKDRKIKEMDMRGKYIIERLFNSYIKHPTLMPRQTYDRYWDAKVDERVLVILDHISGMTDRYATDRFDELCKVERRSDFD